jgi:HEAT repeat protein
MSFVMPLTTPHVAAALRDAVNGSPEARWVAAQALGSVSGKNRNKAIEALYQLQEDPVEEVRTQALEGLAEQMRAGTHIAVERFLGALDDPSSEVRCAAIDATAQIPGDFTARISSLLTDMDPSVRAVAAAVLGELQAVACADQLAHLLEDTVGFVQAKTAIALAEMGDGRGVAVLLSLLESSSDKAYDAVLALGNLGDDKVSPHLEKLASRLLLSQPLKAAAATAMVRCQATRGRDLLNAMMRSRFRGTRMAALGALARMPVTGMAPSVARLLDKNNPVEVSSAIQTLCALSKEEDGDACREALEDRRGRLITDELNEELNEAIALYTQQ